MRSLLYCVPAPLNAALVFAFKFLVKSSFELFMNIYLFFILCFLIFGILGYFTKTSRWRWVDFVYYLLGAIGVCLLFTQSTNDRKIIELYDLQSKQRAEIAAVERQKPRFSEFNSEDELIETYGGHLAHISRFANACGDVIKTTECQSAKSMSVITKEYETKFVQFSGAERVQTVCSSAIPMIESLGESDTLGVTLYTSLLSYYKAGIDKGFYQYDYDGVKNYIDGFSDVARKSFMSLVNPYEFSKEDIELLSSEFEETLYFTKHILSSLNVCFRAPEAIRNGEYSDWSNKRLDKVNSLKELQERAKSIANDRGIKNDNVTKFQFLYWPFVIVLALSLKFGKAVNSLVPNKN